MRDRIVVLNMLRRHWRGLLHMKFPRLYWVLVRAGIGRWCLLGRRVWIYNSANGPQDGTWLGPS